MFYDGENHLPEGGHSPKLSGQEKRIGGERYIGVSYMIKPPRQEWRLPEDAENEPRHTFILDNDLTPQTIKAHEYLLSPKRQEELKKQFPPKF